MMSESVVETERSSRPRVSIGQQREELLSALNLGLVPTMLGGLPATALYMQGRLALLPWLSVVFSCLLVLGLWILSRKSIISRRRMYLWRAVLLVACGMHAGAWLNFSMQAANPIFPSFIAEGLAALALLPLLYWSAGFFVAVVLWIAAVAVLPDLRPSTAGAVLVALPFGGVFMGLLSRFRRGRQSAQDARKALSGIKERHQDALGQLRQERKQLKQCQEELVQARKLAEEVDQAKTEFLATISHEIRTPLNGILPILDMLQDTHLDSQQQRYVRAATASSRHLLRIINDILDFARAESGKLQLESIEINLHELLESVVDLMRSSAEHKGLEVHLDISPQVPLMVRGDPIRLRQILANLLNNAIKFTEKGQVDLRVEPRRAGHREIELYFEVRDTGIGLSQEQIGRLFESFTQADASTTRKHGGTGLGLAICRRLIDLMGGRIGAKSTPGQGSIFWFQLPMRRSVQDVPSTRTSLQGVRIVNAIIDANLVLEVSRHLQRWGVQEQQVQPAELLQRLRDSAHLGKSWAVECLLLDCWGSENSLLPVLREIRDDPLLRSLNIVVILRQATMADRLQSEFSVYPLTGLFHAEVLRRLLNRLFDVNGSASFEAEKEDLLNYLDLNMDQDLMLPDPTTETLDPVAPRAQVLVVEDNPVNLGVMRGMLRRLNVVTLEAENGRQALDLLAKDTQVDLVLMDCQMPIMDGYEAARQWRAREQKGDGYLPIVALTANAMPGDREKCLEAGMDDYLAKPVGRDELSRMLDKWLGADIEVQEKVPPPRELKPPAEQERRMLERGVLEELREVMGDDFRQLVQTYLDTAPDLVDQLRQAADDGDVEAMVLSAHSLKSGSANMGAMHLSAMARDTEMAARKGDLEAARKAASGIPAAFVATCAALRSELGGA